MNTFELFHDHVISQLVAQSRVLLELALLLRKTIDANFLLSIHALQPQSTILRMKLGERGIIGNIIGDVREVCKTSAVLQVYCLLAVQVIPMGFGGMYSISGTSS